MKPLNQLTATEIVQGIAAGRTTAEAVARACLDRIGERESAVQAWQFLDPGDVALAVGVNQNFGRGVAVIRDAAAVVDDVEEVDEDLAS